MTNEINYAKHFTSQGRAMTAAQAELTDKLGAASAEARIAILERLYHEGKHSVETVDYITTATIELDGVQVIKRYEDDLFPVD